MPENKRIFLSSPHMSREGYEKKYINDAFDINFIAPLGPNVDAFESEIADYTGMRGAAATVSGTSAIHLAIKAAGVHSGDVVFCSDLTFSASANPICYENAKPVFIDCGKSLNISPAALDKALEAYTPKAIIIVNLYGQSADFDAVYNVLEKHSLIGKTTIIEDAAESLGAKYKGKMSGTLGDFGIFSFNGNKIITTSGGGMLISNNSEKIKKARFWSTQSRENFPYYQHEEIGYNYRMSNISAGIGRGQLRVLEERVKQKTHIFNTYKSALDNFCGARMSFIDTYGDNSESGNTRSNHWLSILDLGDNKTAPAEIIKALENENVEARYLWKPMHMQPVFRDAPFFTAHDSSDGFDSDSAMYFNRCVCLPSDSKMTDDEIHRVINIIKNTIS